MNSPVKRVLRRVAVTVSLMLSALSLVAWGGWKLYRSDVLASPALTLPTTSVRRGDVTLAVNARGELQGGNSEMMTVPMTGANALAITFLRESGELVKEGEVVVKFDTTEQEFKLREAESDLAEAEQQVAQAEAESSAKEEEARSALVQSRAELRLAELECRRNELLARMVARQNELALEAARDKVNQLERDLADRISTAKAGVAIQEAGRSKAKVAAETARRNIDMMTLKAKHGGYVARQPNMMGNFRWGSYVPALQVGDSVRAGMAVAQIPDLANWEASARIGELDKGYLAVGQPASITVVALPGKTFKGSIKSMGGTTGPPWDRHFETRLALDEPTPELRPGMSTRINITTEVLKDALWLPSQALFEADGRKFVYVRNGGSFTPKDVELKRRSESQVVIAGLKEGEVVSLANPEQMKKPAQSKTGGAMQAIPR